MKVNARNLHLRFVDELRKVRLGFANGIEEFIQASRGIQKDLGLEPMSEAELRTVLRLFAGIGLICIYISVITFIAR
jgi:hypothetical protein